MTTITLYGIKNCDTVKKAKHWLEQHALCYQFHDVRLDGLSLIQLQDFAARSDWNRLLNRNSSSWRQLTPAHTSDLTETKALQLIHDIPTLLKRPVLDAGDKLIIGFKAELYQSELL